MRRILTLLICVLFSVTKLSAQDRTITGKVLDINNKPVSGASVILTGSDKGIMADADGSFSITITPEVKSFKVSSVGYKSQTIKIGAENLYVVKLVSGVNTLDEVVITGYANQKKSEYAGAASKVNAAEIQNVPYGSFDQILQGRVPGLVVLSGSGQPGEAASLLLRGPTSIEGGSDPLYIVDGIPVEAGVFQGINANDIATVDVLKDASAAALYGSRGASGVIVVTTKRGTGGKMRVGFSTQYGVKYKPEFGFTAMSSPQLLKAQEDLGQVYTDASPDNVPLSVLDEWGNEPTLPGWQYSANNLYKKVNGAPELKTQEDFDLGNKLLDSLKGINSDWDELFYQNGNFSNNEVSFSGGTGKTKIYANLGYYKEEGINVPSDMKRVTLRTNVDYKDDKLTFALSSNIGYTRRNFQTGELNSYNSVISPFTVTNLTPRYVSPTLADGSYNVGASVAHLAPNYLDKTAYDKVYNNQVKGVIGLSLNYDITKNIYAGLMSGIDFRETNSTVYNDPRVYDTYSSSDVQTQSGSYSDGLTRFFQANLRGYIGYKNVFEEKHAIDVTGYAEYLKDFSKSFSGLGYGIDPRTPNTIAGVTAGNATNQLFQSIGGGKSERALESVMANARYTYDKKYTLTGTYRYDGVSSLPEKNRFHGFYSFGAIWDVTQEKFMASSKIINALRLKFSYGQAANVDNFPFGDFGYLPTYNTQANLVSGNTGIVAATPGNPDGDWEYTNTTNLGIEYSIFDNRLYGDVQLYNKVTKNLFVSLNLSATSGFANQSINAGSMYNKGIEYNVNYDIIRKRDFDWSITVNGAYNKNEVTNLGPVNSYEQGTSLVTVGLPLGSHYEVRWAGVDAATGSPLYYTKDGKLTNVRSDDDRVQDFGTSIPKTTGGFGTNVRYKSIELSAFFSYAGNYYRVNNLPFFTENAFFLQQGINQSSTLNFWKKPGDVVDVPSPLYENQFSSKLIENSSFCRLRNVTLSYTLSQNVIKKIKFMSNARIYVLGQNLLTWTSWKGLDPEGDSNLAISEYPNPRAITFGLDITF